MRTGRLIGEITRMKYTFLDNSYVYNGSSLVLKVLSMDISPRRVLVRGNIWVPGSCARRDFLPTNFHWGWARKKNLTPYVFPRGAFWCMSHCYFVCFA